MIQRADKSMTGKGVYTLPEASVYTGVPRSTLRTWFMPRPDRKGLGPVFKSDWDRVDGDFAISFLNLIEAYVASFFKKNGATHADIRRTSDILKSKLNLNHPFAYVNLSVALGKIIEESGEPDNRYSEVISKQLVFSEFKAGLLRLSYDPQTQLADKWQIAENIFIIPKVGFGKPVIDSTGVSTLIVANQFKANGKDAALVARLFNVPKDSVINAFRFEQRLGRIAA
jgi:uncharacterized protein (DUF433 family)